MDCTKTVNFLKEAERMCRHKSSGSECCKSCLLSCENNGTHRGCDAFMHHYPEKAVEIVQKWSDEDPPKTYLTELLKAFPDAKLGENGVPNMCPSRLGLKNLEDCTVKSCVECWNQPIEEREK